MRQYHRWLPVKRIVHTPDGFGPKAGSAQHALIPISFSNSVHCMIQIKNLFGIIEQIDLIVAAD